MNKDTHSITTYQAGAKQASVHRSLQKLSDMLLEPFGITKMQWLIIGHVLDAGKSGIRMSDLAAILSTTLPYVTTAVSILEARGYLSRTANDEDARSKLLVVSLDFISTCELIEQTLRDGLRKSLYNKIDPEEFHIYLKVLWRLEEAANDTFTKDK